VWDNGGNDGGGLSGLGRRMIGVLPPMHDVARLAGLELPDYLGNLRAEAATPEAQPTETASESDGEA
jgi:flotillin